MFDRASDLLHAIRRHREAEPGNRIPFFGRDER
jgi:hypothetical protein